MPRFEWLEVNADRNLRGPYSAAGELIRWLVPRAVDTPGLIEPHLLTLLCVCPALAAELAVPDDVARWLRLSREGNARSWTLRLAHGLTDFVVAFASQTGSRLGVSLENAEEADPLDREFFGVLKRRANPEFLRVRECASLGTRSLNNGQGGGDPETLLEASRRYLHLAYYEAARDRSIRGRQITGDEARDHRYTELTRNLLYASLLLGNYGEVEEICAETTAQSGDPALLAHVAYAQAILNARLYGPARRDLDASRRWIEKALALTEMLPASSTRVVNLAFLRNTLALVEMRSGRFEQAYNLLTDGLESIAQNAPEKYDEECVLLLHNRARLQTAWGRPDRALEDLTTLLRHQPGVSEVWLDRGILHRRAGRLEEALSDIDAAIRWSPPYPESFFNRAEVLAALKRTDEAVDVYGYVLTLAPENAEARSNRGCLHFERRQIEAAHADVEAGLKLKPEHARLVCLRGLLELGEGASAEALESFTEAIRLDPKLADAWANRATVYFRRGDAEKAEADLTKAIGLRDDASTRYNRGRVFESQGKWCEAAKDYSRAVELGVDDRNIRARLRRCEVSALPAS